MPEVFVAKILREIANKGLDFRLPERRMILLGKFRPDIEKGGNL